MLFFLRQLRRIELRKRSGQYFIYAFGEILLIVVGILIAMQIQNWNEGRKDRERVRGHLEEIKSGLVFDLERREEMMKSLNLHDEAGVYLMDYLSDKIESVDMRKLSLAFLQAAAESIFSLSRTPYDSLISSGNIELIHNDRLKSNLSVLHDREGWDKSFLDEGIRSVYTDFLFYRFEFTESGVIRDYFLDNSELLDGVDLAVYQASDQEDSINWEAVKKDPQFRVKLDRVIAYRVLQKIYYNTLEKQMLELIEQIDAELAK